MRPPSQTQKVAYSEDARHQRLQEERGPLNSSACRISSRWVREVAISTPTLAERSRRLTTQGKAASAGVA